MTYWNDPREDNYSFDQSFQWNAAMSNLNGMPVRTYKEPSSIIKLTEGGDTPQPDVLNFYMPNGGTISLNKTGSPTVVELEYSLDRGKTWTVWPKDQDGNRNLTLTAGQRMYVRNTSETSTGFSTAYGTDYYYFDFSDVTYANGNTNSLLCKDPQDAVITNSCFTYLYRNCGNLKTASSLPSTTLANSCYRAMFSYTSIEKSPLLPASIIPTLAYRSMFYASVNLSEIKTYMTDISSHQCIDYWCGGGIISETGDFYCPAELTIPTGSSGIPSGWTRYDI